MPTEPRPRATGTPNVVPPNVPSANVANSDPTVQRALQQHAETLNRILKFLNDNFKPAGQK